MPRLIDADALKEDIEQQCALLRLMKDNDELNQISTVLESGFMAQIDKMPTISERKKGKWIDMGDFEQCSVCTGTHLKTVNTVYGKAIWIKSAYCPNCGADMRGET